MAEKVTAGPITSANGVREAVCIHTKKIFSSCKDKDCIEDLTFYPTATAQSVIDASQSIRGGRVELLHVGVDVEPVSFNRGFFTVDMRFYYRVILQAVNNGMRATEILGLSTFDKRVMLFGGESRAKDQSYVLYQLTQEQLSHLLLPVGSFEKPEIREQAEEAGLANAHQADSQDICFIPDGDYVRFLRDYGGVTPQPGDFVDETGRVLGRHRGLECYTAGQRKGLGVSADRPLYVLSMDAKHNTVLLGDDAELFSSALLASRVNWIAGETPAEKVYCTAKTRYSQKECDAVVTPLEGGCAHVELLTPQRAVTAGQAVVFYDGEEVLGGGTIEKAL